MVNPVPGNIKGGITASANAAKTTIGVYTPANFDMKFSVFDFFAAAFSTRSSILLAVDSLNSFVTSRLNSPSLFILPLYTWSPTFTLFGTDSPVSAEVSSIAFPETTIPSSGIISPAFICILAPISTSYGSTVSTLPSSFIRLA